jgi:hypothetical protein
MEYRIAEKDGLFYPEQMWPDNIWRGISNDELMRNTFRMSEKAAQFKSLEEARAFLDKKTANDEIKFHNYP